MPACHTPVRNWPAADESLVLRLQVENAAGFSIRYFPTYKVRQGVMHAAVLA